MKVLPLLLLLWPSFAYAQLSENFEDGNFTNDPEWYGDTALWHVKNGKLNSDFVATNRSFQYFFQLSTKSERVENTVWEFWMKTGSTSRNNFIRIFLCSQDSVLGYDKRNRGYFLNIGNTSDNVCLYKKDNLKYSLLIKGRENITDHAELKIKVVCDSLHRWSLYTAETGSKYVLEGVIADSTFLHSRYFNIVVFQRGKSANHSHWLDNIFIKPIQDTAAPQLTAPFEVVINEIYADPTPSHGLPETEYIELHNVSGHVVDLAGWQICDRGRCADIPSVSLLSDSMLLLCDTEDKAALSAFGEVAGLPHFISLNNSGDDLYLKDKEGKLISVIHYTKESYRDDEKAKGGWSLELQYSDYPCLIKGSLAASNASIGGSPGRRNKVKNNETPFLSLEYVAVLDSIHLMAKLNAAVNVTAVRNAQFTINGKIISNVKPESEISTRLVIRLQAPLKKRKVYHLHVSELESCGLVTGVENQAKFGLPEPASSRNVIINEILFNPYDESEDFVELYNTSNKIIDLRNLFLADRNNGVIDKLFPVSSGAYYLLPGQYVAVTTDIQDLLDHYICKYPNQLVETDKMPSYNNTSGEVVLANAQKIIIDKMQYREDDHSPFFHNNEGVSLERINPLVASTDQNNWASASTVSGYATPGYRNSQFMKNGSTGQRFKVDPEVFSPDGDGLDDLVFVKYTLPSGYAATINVYNEYGILVRHLKSNVSLSTKGTIPWNGKNDSGVRLPTGIYIFFVGLDHPSGRVSTYKIPVTLVKRR